MNLRRNDVVERLRGYVVAGADVDLVGQPGSGRSTLLRLLADSLRETGWRVLALHPISVLKGTPLAAMAAALRDATGAAAPVQSLHEAGDELARLAEGRALAILVDDWDDLDEASWAAIAGVRASGVPLPVVAAQRYGDVRPRPRHALPASPGDAAMTVSAPALSMGEMQRLLAEELGGPVEQATVSRIYAKSAGLPGLALAIGRIAKAEGSLRSEHGVWMAVRDLWSPALQGACRRLLEDLDASTRSGLATLALAGLIDLAGARRLVDQDVLEELEQRKLIRIADWGDRRWVSLNPPLLAEYFRHEGGTVRLERIATRMDEEELRVAQVDEIRAAGLRIRPADPLFYRLVRERQQHDLRAATQRWHEEPQAASAIALLDALNETAADPAEIRELLADPRADVGTPDDLARLRVRRAWWIAFGDGDPDAAMRALDRVDGLGAHGRLLDAARVRIALELASVPEDVEALLAVDDGLPLSVRAELQRTHAAVLVSRGRMQDALDRLSDLSSWTEDSPPYLQDVTRGFALLGLGAFDRAAVVALEGFERARDELDPASLRAFGHLLGVLLFVRGQYASLRPLRDIVLGVGGPAHYPKGAYLGVLCCVATGAVDDAADAAARLEAAEALPVPDGPLPGMTRSWPRARTLAAARRPEAAADVLWASALELRDRGDLFSAATNALSAVEYHPDRARLDEATAWLEPSDLAHLAAYAGYLRAVADEDADALMRSIPELARMGMLGHAVAAFGHAANAVRTAGDEQRGAAIEGELADFLETLEPGSFDSAPNEAAGARLTVRERQVVDLVVAGLTNQQVADRLVLSVRTVENHIHRAMRKEGVSSRHELR